MLPNPWGQVDFSPEKWLISIGLGKVTKSQREPDSKNSYIET